MLQSKVLVLLCALTISLASSDMVFASGFKGSSNRLIKRYTQFFVTKDSGAKNYLKQLLVGGAILVPLVCAGMLGVRCLVDTVDVFRSKFTPIEVGEHYLNTVIRFDDGIIGEKFYYHQGIVEGVAEAVEWEFPFRRIKMVSLKGEYFYLPIESLQGKEVKMHDYVGVIGAEVTFREDGDTFKGRVYRFFSDDTVEVVVRLKLNANNEHEKLNELRFVKDENIFALKKHSYY